MNTVVAVNAFSLWLYVVFVVAATAVSMATMVVTDSATCEVLAEKGSFVGKLRLWAFVSIGISSLLIGALIGVDNSGIENNVGFTPCFYVVAVFALLDILFLFRAPRLKMSNRSTGFFKDTWTVLKSIDMMVFSCFLASSAPLVPFTFPTTSGFWKTSVHPSSQSGLPAQSKILPCKLLCFLSPFIF
ncbi:unnamed protein product [Ixodes pacificus]